MQSITCFVPSQDLDADEGEWQEIADPPYLVLRPGGLLAVEIPFTRGRYPRAFANGLPVLGSLQIVKPYDLVLIAEGLDKETDYVVGNLSPTREAGEGRPCMLTGLPLTGEAVRCPCGILVAPDVEKCPVCERSLDVEGAAQCPPSEVLQ